MLAEIVSWPEAVVSVVGILGFVAFFNGQWPWEGIIVRHYHCRCKGGKNCECHNQDEEDEDEDED